MGKRYYIILGILLLLFILINASTPNSVSWKPTFKKHDKNPYGAEVTYKFLEDIFGTGNISYSRRSPYDLLHDNKDTFNLIYVANEVGTYDADFNAIHEFLDKGNNVFIAASAIYGPLADSLGLSGWAYHEVPETFKDSVTLSFTNPLFPKMDYVFPQEQIQNYIDPDTSVNMIVLSESSDYYAHFVKVPVGNGFLYYHCNPMLFTNNNMLFNNNQHDYISNCLSYLPKTKTVWSEFFSAGGSQEHETDLRFILSNPQLRWAWYIIIAFVLVFLVFQSKRKQRAIPVVTPPKNSTLEFVETTGRLYFQQRDHLNLAHKKILFFLEKIRNKFYISTSVLDDEFVESLASKSGVPQEEIRELVARFEQIKKSTGISENTLLELNKNIESFYNKAGL